MLSYYTPKMVCQIVGLTYRQIQYADWTGLARPSRKRCEKYRLYTFADLAKLFVMVQLNAEGVSPQRFRTLSGEWDKLIKQIRWPIAETVVLFDGQGFMLFSCDCLMSVKASKKLVRISLDDLRVRCERYSEAYEERRVADLDATDNQSLRVIPGGQK